MGAGPAFQSRRRSIAGALESSTAVLMAETESRLQAAEA